MASFYPATAADTTQITVSYPADYPIFQPWTAANYTYDYTGTAASVIQLGTAYQSLTTTIADTTSALQAFSIAAQQTGWYTSAANFTYGSNYGAYLDWGIPAEPYVESPELRRRRERDQLRRKRERVLAVRRGRKLLLSLLNDQQQREYAYTGKITVPAADGRVFRLRKGKTAERLTVDGRADAAYCIHLSGGYVAEDTLIAQLLLLQHDPAEFERIANITKITPPPPVDPATRRMLDEAARTARPIYAIAA